MITIIQHRDIAKNRIAKQGFVHHSSIKGALKRQSFPSLVSKESEKSSYVRKHHRAIIEEWTNTDLFCYEAGTQQES